MIVVSLWPDGSVGRVRRVIVLPIDIHEATHKTTLVSLFPHTPRHATLLGNERRSVDVAAEVHIEQRGHGELNCKVDEDRRGSRECCTHVCVEDAGKVRSLVERLREVGSCDLCAEAHARHWDPEEELHRAHGVDEVLLDCPGCEVNDPKRKRGGESIQVP